MKDAAADQAYQDVTWSPPAAVILTIIFYVLGQIGGLIILFAVLMFGRRALGIWQQPLEALENNTIIQFIASLGVAAVVLGLIWGYLRLAKAKRSSLGIKKFQSKDVGYALVGYGLYFLIFLAVSVVVSLTSPDLLEQEQDIGFSRLASGAELIPIFITLVIIPPVIEEVLCRGFLFGGLRTKLPFAWATVITSLMFAAAHLQWGNSTPLVWVAAIDTFVLSVVLCTLRERTGRLWSPMLLHGIKNALAFATIFLFKWS